MSISCWTKHLIRWFYISLSHFNCLQHLFCDWSKCIWTQSGRFFSIYIDLLKKLFNVVKNEPKLSPTPNRSNRFYHIPGRSNCRHRPLNLLYFAVAMVNDIAWHNILKRDLSGSSIHSNYTMYDSWFFILTKIFPGLSLGIVVRRYFMVNLLFLLQRGFLILIKDVLIYSNVIK